MTPFIGQIIIVGFNFAPQGYALCNGQLLPISQNQALFSLLGTFYGGNGQTNFALPDLRGRFPMHAGQGNGLTPRPLGSRGGLETTTLTVQNLPSHSHAASGRQGVLGQQGSSTDPTGRIPAQLVRETAYGAGPPTAFHADGSVEVTVNPAGGNQAFNHMPPFQVVNFAIALQGIFPSPS
ncbi:phage tail protein [Wenzhouxiangella marina]|uniref:Tail Collar domain protein n=1 Tax=Wenzhouxiangella marina TaxID=1579979 RepID=A0A0K0XV10_9GAMM|nr:tail fiber protein [Wenzhouxiangella marina]AKS41518.1 Tail Collar domain protein [Wenzhouxiangella marina]MBB6086723.1 microcystin-dependent protein [Wenzhouxiangella marina]